MEKSGLGQATWGRRRPAAFWAQDEKGIENVIPGLGLKKN